MSILEFSSDTDSLESETSSAEDTPQGSKTEEIVRRGKNTPPRQEWRQYAKFL